MELYRHDVDVTIVHRGEGIKPTAKYWFVPDLQNRIKEGKIKILFNKIIDEISENEIFFTDKKSGKKSSLAADHVFLLVGYLPNEKLLKACGLSPNPEDLKVPFDPLPYESEVEGLYLCGTVLAGIRTESVFIENGREHAIAIADDIVKNYKSIQIQNN